MPSASVILSTYNSPEWLEKVIYGFRAQTFKDFELLVADDGSGEETRALMEKLASDNPFPLRHVWQRHDGFGKCAILNKAIAASRSDYLVFTDGDCVPRADFLAVHMELRRPGHYISGGYCKLPMSTSKTITPEDIAAQHPFETDWLRNHGCRYVPAKIWAHGCVARFFNAITTTKPSWNGHNASGWTRDIVAVNGYNEDMQYGGLDRELGERLVNYGIKPIQVRHLAICVHLDHARGYKTRETLEKNAAIRRQTRGSGRTWAENGIVKGVKPEPQTSLESAVI